MKNQTFRKLSQEDIEEFKTIYQKQYGETLSDKQAEEAAMALIELVYITQLPTVD